MNESPKKSSIKIFFWIALLVVVLLITAAVVMKFFSSKDSNTDNQGQNTEEQKDSGDKNTQKQSGGDSQTMTDSQVAAAKAVIASGVSIDDTQSDWYKFPAGSVQGDGRPDNTSPYPLAYTDIKNVSFGADANYIYFKFTYWGAMPTSLPAYNRDDVKFYCDNIAISKYVDKSGQTQVGQWQIGTTYIEPLETGPDSNIERSTNYKAIKPTIGLSTFGEYTSTDKTSESVYRINDNKGLTYAGPGNNYVIAGFPLSTLGIKLGDTIEFAISYEGSSRTYHHEFVDLLLGKDNNKEGDTIQYTLGSNTYKNLGFQMEAGKQ